MVTYTPSKNIDTWEIYPYLKLILAFNMLTHFSQHLRTVPAPTNGYKLSITVKEIGKTDEDVADMEAKLLLGSSM